MQIRPHAFVRIKMFSRLYTILHSSQFEFLRSIIHSHVRANSNLCEWSNTTVFKWIWIFALNQTLPKLSKYEGSRAITPSYFHASWNVRANSNIRAWSLVQRLHPRIFAGNRTFPFLSEFEFLRAITSSNFYAQSHLPAYKLIRIFANDCLLAITSSEFKQI